MHTLYVLWSAFFLICRLQLRPQDLPASSILLILSLCLYTLVSMTLSLFHLSIKPAILSALLDTSLLILLTNSLLYIVHYSVRINQTLTALAGTNSVLGILSIPLLFWLEQLQLQPGDIALPELLLLGLIMWNIAVYAHILRHALEVPFFVGVGLTIITHLLTFALLNLIIN